MAIEMIPEWLANLEEEDVAFIKRFLLASGSLKEIAAQYGVSYPTVRLRLDRLIQKIKMSESTESDPYIAMVKHLAVDDRLDFDTAKLLDKRVQKDPQGGAIDGKLQHDDVLIFHSTAHWAVCVGDIPFPHGQ